MKIKTRDLEGAALDWAVAKCLGRDTRPGRWRGKFSSNHGIWQPTKSWTQGGPIIEQERINVTEDVHLTMDWIATIYVPDEEPWQYVGPTPLIAAMRCFVASVLGAETDIPDELTPLTGD